MVGSTCFFFQAEDGIRDIGVTGVQTCALPIWGLYFFDAPAYASPSASAPKKYNPPVTPSSVGNKRSEERRVGKEWRYRCTPHQLKKNSTRIILHHFKALRH